MPPPDIDDINLRLTRIEVELKRYVDVNFFIKWCIIIGLPVALIIGYLGNIEIQFIPRNIERIVNESLNDESTSELISEKIRDRLERDFGPYYQQRVRHIGDIMVGSTRCEQKVRRTGDAWEDAEVLNVTFDYPFMADQVPSIFLSLTGIEAYYRQPADPIQLIATNITSRGFDIRIRSAYANSISYCKVDWIAIPPSLGSISDESANTILHP